jgi:hypothetical protein
MPILAPIGAGPVARFRGVQTGVDGDADGIAEGLMQVEDLGERERRQGQAIEKRWPLPERPALISNNKICKVAP